MIRKDKLRFYILIKNFSSTMRVILCSDKLVINICAGAISLTYNIRRLL